MPQGALPRRTAVAALSLLLASCWQSSALDLLTGDDDSSKSGPKRGLQGSIVVSGASGASLDLEDEVEPNDNRGHARRLQVPTQGASIRRGVVSAGRQLMTLRGAGSTTERTLLDLFPSDTEEHRALPAARPDFTPDWLTVGSAGVLLFQAGSTWTGEFQEEERPTTLARWQQPARGVVHGLTLVEDLLFVLVDQQGRRLLLSLDPWTGLPLWQQELSATPWSGLAAARNPATGALQIYTMDAGSSHLWSADLVHVHGDLTLQPFDPVGPIPRDLRPESLAHDGDLAWFLDAEGRVHAWCTSTWQEVTSLPLDPSGPPARRLAARPVRDRDGWYLVVPAGQSVTLDWQAAADDQVDLLVLDRTAALKGARETLVDSRRVSGPAVQHHTLRLTAGASARSFDLVQFCRSGTASWALALGDTTTTVALLPRPPPLVGTFSDALASHDRNHALHGQAQALLHGRPEWHEHVDGQVVIGESHTAGAVPQSLAGHQLQDRYRSPAGHRVMDFTPHRAATPDDPDTFQGRARPRADLRLENRRLARLLDELERHPRVQYAELVARARVQSVTPSDPLWKRQRWAHKKLNLPQAWDYTRGSPRVIIGVVDSGVRTEHDDLSPVLLPGYDFVDDANNSGDGDGMDPDPYDDGGPASHGTHVAGIIAARGDNGFGISGVVMNGSILPVRAIGVDGTGSLLDVAEAIRYAAGLPNRSGLVPDKACQVINLSLGTYSDFTPLKQAVTAAMRAGVLVLAAAGNDGRPGLLYPANYQRVVAVGASTLTDERAPYSNTGARLDVLAPGGSSGDADGDGQPDQIYSARGDANGDRPGGFQYLMGTSMACAGASGAAALLLALKPGATGDEVAAIMTSTAQDLGPPGFDASHGHGRLDVLAAMQGISPVLMLNTEAVDLGDNGASFVVQMTNLGGGTLTVDDLISTPVLGPGGWLTATALPDGNSIALAADRSGLAPGPHAVDLRIATSGGAETVSVTLNETAGPVPDVGTVIVEVRTRSGTLKGLRRAVQGKGYQWKLTSLPKGAYQLHCGVDLDGDGVLGESGEPYGVYPDTSRPVLIHIQSGRLITDLVLE